MSAARRASSPPHQARKRRGTKRAASAAMSSWIAPLRHSNGRLPNVAKIINESLPACAARVDRERLSRNKHVWSLRVGGQIEDRGLFPVHEHDEERKINAGRHAFLLHAPSCTQNPIGQFFNRSDRDRFYLSEISAEIANDIGALEVLGKALQCSLSLAARAMTLLDNQFFASLAERLFLGWHFRQKFVRPSNSHFVETRVTAAVYRRFSPTCPTVTSLLYNAAPGCWRALSCKEPRSTGPKPISSIRCATARFASASSPERKMARR